MPSLVELVQIHRRRANLFDRSRSSKTELLAKVLDHCSMKYKRGYRMLTLGWSDGNSFIPVNHCLLSAADNKNLLCEASVYDGCFSIKEVYNKNRKRRGRSKYLLSVNVTIGGEDIPAKIVCVCNKSKKKDWLAILSTDTYLSEEEIIRIYGKKWDIEVFSNPVNPISVS